MTHCLLNLYLFIPSALRFGVQQAAPRAGPGRLWCLASKGAGNGGKRFRHPIEQGKGARGEFLAQKIPWHLFLRPFVRGRLPRAARHRADGQVGNLSVLGGGKEGKKKAQMVSLGTANALIKGH